MNSGAEGAVRKDAELRAQPSLCCKFMEGGPVAVVLTTILSPRPHTP